MCHDDAVGAGLRVGDADIKDGLTSAIPEAVAACIAALFRDRSFCVGLWLPLLLPLLLLCLLLLLMRRWRGGWIPGSMIVGVGR